MAFVVWVLRPGGRLVTEEHDNVKKKESWLALKAHVILERDSEEDDYVLIDSRTGRMCVCNETASAVVPHLRDGSTVEQITLTLVTRFAVTRDVATRDLNTFLDVLAAEGLLDAKP